VLLFVWPCAYLAKSQCSSTHSEGRSLFVLNANSLLLKPLKLLRVSYPGAWRQADAHIAPSHACEKPWPPRRSSLQLYNSTQESSAANWAMYSLDRQDLMEFGSETTLASIFSQHRPINPTYSQTRDALCRQLVSATKVQCCQK